MDDDKARCRSRTEVEKIEEYLFREATDWTRGKSGLLLHAASKKPR